MSSGNKHNEKLNTHFYDRKLKKRYYDAVAMEEKLLPPAKKTLEETVDDIKKQMSEDKWGEGQKRMEAEASLECIGLSEAKDPNYDKTNDIHTGDLLRRLWRIAVHYDISTRSIVYDQLADMKRGNCPQGRAIRLVQIYLTHWDTEKNTVDDFVLKLIKFAAL